MATRKVWKGFLNFGLISIPVGLCTGARDVRIELHKYHAACGSPVKTPTTCPKCNVPVSGDQVVKGFETATGYVPITAEELASIAPSSEKVMEVSSCVPWADVDPLYLAESFYLVPEPAGRKAYGLLAHALAKSGKCAVTRLTKNNREHIMVIRAKGNGLVAHCLYYPAEVNQVPEFESLDHCAISSEESALAVKLIENLESDFQPEGFEDGYAKRLEDLIASKREGKVVAFTPSAAPKAPVVDMLSALKASLAAKPKAKKRSKVA